MTAQHDFAFIQARLQARHGARLSEEEWQLLRSNRSLGLFLEKARTTPLSRWTDQLHANMKPHTIERLLRASWRDYVAEIAHWPDRKWRDAILWLAHLPDLPILDYLLKGGPAPKWLGRDTRLTPFTLSDPKVRDEAVHKSRLGPIVYGNDNTQSIRARWAHHFEEVWPSDEKPYLPVLTQPLDRLFRSFEVRAGAIKVEEKLAELTHILTRLFRRYLLTPVVVFTHLGLVVVDLFRLRGDLLARCLFPESHEVGTS